MLRKIEQLEAGQQELVSRRGELERELARVSTMEKVTDQDIRALLDEIEGMMLKELSRDRLKELLRGMLEKVTLDPVTFAGHNHYRIPLDSGELVASPRGFEPRLSP